MTQRELPHLKTVERAAVRKGTDAVATLLREGAHVRFAYRPEVVEAGFPAVATTLPVRAAPVVLRGGAVPPYFAGLLPAGSPCPSRTRGGASS